MKIQSIALPFKFLGLLVAFALFGKGLNAQTYCLTYAVTNNGTTLDVTLGVIASGSAFRLGAGNLQFKYKTAAISTPILISNALASTGRYNGITVTNFAPPSFAGTGDGLASFNFNFTGILGTGLPIELSGTNVAVIRFQIVNANLSPNLRPYDNGSAGTVVYNDDPNDPQIIETTGNCPAYDNVSNGVKVQLKVFLEGAYQSSNNLMLDGLRTSNALPLTEPYTSLGFVNHGGGGETTTNAVLAVTGNNAIVDWVFLELRYKLDPTLVFYTRSALIQRDGDIVDVDGISAVTFTGAPSDDYYIAIKHRNHLGFRPLRTISLSASSTSLDFTNNSILLYGSRPALKQIATGVYGMYAGDANHNGIINSVDKNNYWRLQNGSSNYQSADFDLNGTVNTLDKNDFWLLNNSILQQLD